MGLLTKIADFLSGGLSSTIVEAVKEYYPPSMSETEQAELSERINAAANKQINEAAKLANEAQAEYNQRIKDLEGTAKDLKSIPIIGPIVIFLRGCQRPIWGYSTLYIDVMVFSGDWDSLSDTQESALWVINLLVLGFLFGERAVKNLAPLIERLIKIKLGTP